MRRVDQIHRIRRPCQLRCRLQRERKGEVTKERERERERAVSMCVLVRATGVYISASRVIPLCGECVIWESETCACKRECVHNPTCHTEDVVCVSGACIFTYCLVLLTCAAISSM